MIVNVLIGGAVAVAGLLVVVASRPSEYRVTRTATIAGPPAAIFPHMNELRKFNAWNPWAKLDPDARTTFEGPPAGAGAWMTWDGDKSVGEGRMTITESRPDELVRYRLDFVRPFTGTADAALTLKPEGAQTAVTWTMEGQNNFLAKAIGLVMNMETMIGGQFEKGLASLNQEIKR